MLLVWKINYYEFLITNVIDHTICVVASNTVFTVLIRNERSVLRVQRSPHKRMQNQLVSAVCELPPSSSSSTFRTFRIVKYNCAVFAVCDYCTTYAACSLQDNQAHSATWWQAAISAENCNHNFNITVQHQHAEVRVIVSARQRTEHERENKLFGTYRTRSAASRKCERLSSISWRTSERVPGSWAPLLRPKSRRIWWQPGGATQF